jgi:hypothetical protein
MNRQYIKDANDYLRDIIKNPALTTLEKLQSWNSYVFSTFNRRPNAVNFPLLIPTTTTPFKPANDLVDQAKDIELPISKSLEPNAILNVTKKLIRQQSHLVQRKAFFDTLGKIGENHSQDPE